MKEYVLPPLPALLAPVVDAAVTLALGWLLFSTVELGIYASLVASILSCLITIVVGYVTMNLLSKELLPPQLRGIEKPTLLHGWSRRAGSIRTVNRCVWMSLATITVGCFNLMKMEGFPLIDGDVLPLVLLGTVFIIMLAYGILLIGWHMARQEMDL